MPSRKVKFCQNIIFLNFEHKLESEVGRLEGYGEANIEEEEEEDTSSSPYLWEGAGASH